MTKAVEKEGPELTFSTGNTEIQLFAEQLPMRMPWRPAKKRCSTTKDLKKGLQKMSRRGVGSVIKTHTPIEVTHKQEDHHSCRGSLQEAKDLPLIKLGFPAWGSCTRKAGHRNIWHWKCHGREACIWESQGTVGNRDSSFKGCTQRLYMKARFRLNALII